MTTPLAGSAGPPADLTALTEPTDPVGRWWVAWISVISIGTVMSCMSFNMPSASTPRGFSPKLSMYCG